MQPHTHSPDPIRVMIVLDVARCSVDRAERTIEELDKHDLATQAQAAKRPVNTHSSGNGSATLPAMLSLGRYSLELAGYDRQEAAKILQTLFTGLAAEYGGKSLYLPKAPMMQRKLKHVRDF
ncbi:MAG: hypothetical protein L3K52_05485 [Candidatus Thiothrix sulfatifontis]|nr:MAG: hypothetical protein L3K52_05485 [Candidatus Thiothrix sulfatifontis]